MLEGALKGTPPLSVTETLQQPPAPGAHRLALLWLDVHVAALSAVSVAVRHPATIAGLAPGQAHLIRALGTHRPGAAPRRHAPPQHLALQAQAEGLQLDIRGAPAAMERQLDR